jgi:hypothetical protein
VPLPTLLFSFSDEASRRCWIPYPIYSRSTIHIPPSDPSRRRPPIVPPSLLYTQTHFILLSMHDTDDYLRQAAFFQVFEEPFAFISRCFIASIIRTHHSPFARYPSRFFIVSFLTYTPYGLLQWHHACFPLRKIVWIVSCVLFIQLYLRLKKPRAPPISLLDHILWFDLFLYLLFPHLPSPSVENDGGRSKSPCCCTYNLLTIR